MRASKELQFQSCEHSAALGTSSTTFEKTLNPLYFEQHEDLGETYLNHMIYMHMSTEVISLHLKSLNMKT